MQVVLRLIKRRTRKDMKNVRAIAGLFPGALFIASVIFMDRILLIFHPALTGNH